jgi:hypothetical protein
VSGDRLAQRYALLSAAALLCLAVWNRPAVTLGVSLAGLAAGIWVSRRSEMPRAALFGIGGFALAAALGAIALWG